MGAKAADLASLIMADAGGNSLLSERGSIGVDDRTNTLLIQDTAEKLEQIRRMVARLDIPVRQVLVESRIVLANNDFARDLGVRFGVSHNSQSNAADFVLGGKRPGDVNYADTITAYEAPAGSGNEGLLVDLPVANPSGALGIALGKLGSNLLALELSAMQLEDRVLYSASPLDPDLLQDANPDATGDFGDGDLWPDGSTTEGLLESIPRIDHSTQKKARLTEIQGVVPIPSQLPPGCHFHPRCPAALPECKTVRPQLEEKEEGRFVACINPR